jgi:hypothetical protein
MRYRDNPIYCSLAEAVADIARVATGGSSALALDDLVSAAADGAIEAVGSVANEIAPGKWRRKLAIEPVPAWVWRCIQRGQAGVSVDKCEITIRTYDEKAEAPRRLCYYDIRFEWFDIDRVWPEPEPEPQSDAPIVQSVEVCSANGAEAGRFKRRGAYRNELRKYLADRKLATLLLQGKHAVADEFVEHCRDEKPELVPVLPKPREIANQVEKILVERRAQPVAGVANDRTEPPAKSAKRR